MSLYWMNLKEYGIVNLWGPATKKSLFSFPMSILAIMMCVCVLSCFSPVQLCSPMDCCPPGPFVHLESPVKNTGLGCYALPQRIFSTQGSNPCLLWPLGWQVGSLSLVPPGMPKLLSYCIAILLTHLSSPLDLETP